MTKGNRVDCCGQLQRGPKEDGRPGTGQGDCVGGGDDGARRYCG